MKLSEAIRKGTMFGPQIYGNLKNIGPDGAIKGVCALGGAYLAAGIHPTKVDQEGISSPVRPVKEGCTGYQYIVPSDWWKVFIHQTVCPACQSGDAILPTSQIIAHLNDDHHWPRELIAEFIALVEVRLDLEAVDMRRFLDADARVRKAQAEVRKMKKAAKAAEKAAKEVSDLERIAKLQ